MLTKILITALVIAACFAYLRYQNQRKATSAGQNGRAQLAATKNAFSSQFRWLAGALVALTACAALGLFIYNWIDNRRVMTVNIINPQSGDQISYQVYKGDLKDRSFKTLQGQQVRISNNERIEVTENP